MREWCECLHRQVYTCSCPQKLRDKIERLGAENGQLRAETERLRGVLERIADTDPDEGTAWFHEVARAALDKGEKTND